MNTSRSGKRKKKRRTPFKRFLRFLLILLLLITVGGLAYAGYFAYNLKKVANNSYEEINEDGKSKLREEKVTLKDDPVTILLMGVDDYVKNDKGRTDTLLLLALNPKTKEIGMLSIPRDTRTYIPVMGEKNKINAAYAFGNEKGAVEAVQNFLNIPVDYYIKTGVKGFQDVVDELGGIKVDVPFDFKQVDLKGKYIYFHEGEMKLDGRESLAFVQMRKEDPRGDFGREERQQQAIQSLADKALSLNTLTKANKVVNTLGSNVKTNIQLNELMGLRNFYAEIKNNGINHLVLKGEDQKLNGIYYFKPSESSIQEVGNELRRILEIEQVTQADDNQNDSYDQDGNSYDNNDNNDYNN
jgi:polyisoprenyl-teichoic acid--peptidoglycan teichoic acid transferase